MILKGLKKKEKKSIFYLISILTSQRSTNSFNLILTSSKVLTLFLNPNPLVEVQ